LWIVPQTWSISIGFIGRHFAQQEEKIEEQTIISSNDGYHSISFGALFPHIESNWWALDEDTVDQFSLRVSFKSLASRCMDSSFWLF
jgi:hypothetical protein